MQSKVCFLSAPFAAASLVVLGTLLATATGCDRLPSTPEPMPTATQTRAAAPTWTPLATPAETPVGEIPTEILSARSAALAFLRNQYPARAPADGVAWVARNTSPPGVVGVPSYEFSSDDWLMTVAALPVSADEIIYETGLMNPQTGLRWMGRLDRSYGLLESSLNVAVEVLVARDLVLAYLREHHAEEAPAKAVVWVGERTTPYGLVGHETCQFTATPAGWRMTVDYDVVALAQLVYNVELQADTGLMWRGHVDAEGSVFEHR